MLVVWLQENVSVEEQGEHSYWVLMHYSSVKSKISNSRF